MTGQLTENEKLSQITLELSRKCLSGFVLHPEAGENDQSEGCMKNRELRCSAVSSHEGNSVTNHMASFGMPERKID